MKVPVVKSIVLGLTFVACVGCRREEPAPLKFAGNATPKMHSIVYPTLTPVAMNNTSSLKSLR